MDRYRFALRPKWIFGHLLLVVLVGTFIWCGFWQLRRLHERKAFNSLVRGNRSEAVVDVGKLGIRPDQGTSRAKADQGRRVRLTGTYVADRSMIIRGQSIDSQPGVWVVTPLRTTAGPLVLVNRGFLHDNGALDSPPARSAPPTGRVTVEGTVQPTETPSVFQHRDPRGPQRAYSRLDVDRIRSGLDQPTLPLWVLATGQQPPDPGVALTPVPPPELTNGPHLSYAIQWFCFTAVGLIGYPLLLVRKARETERGGKKRRRDDEVIDLTGGDGTVPTDEKLVTNP